VQQCDALRKTLEAKCSQVPELQQQVRDLRVQLNESVLALAELSKIEVAMKTFTCEREKFKADADASKILQQQVSSLEDQLKAYVAQVQQKERKIGSLCDEIMAIKVQAALKQKTAAWDMSHVETSKGLLEEAAYWRKKCLKAESELQELKVEIAAEARKSFLALAPAPRAQQSTTSQQSKRMM
jgi:hypothetical protein